MARVRVSRMIEAKPADVWAVVADLADHARWQIDVHAIRFTSPRTRGVGATYECDARLGPIRMRRPMEDVEWRATRFQSPPTRGVGAPYECDARLGPIRMRIRMEVVEWRERKSLAVRYDGALSGGGRIALTRRRRGRTLVTWSARVRLPWWL